MIWLFGLPYIAMLLLGAAHSQDARIPNLGYVVCLLLTLTVAAFVWAVRALTQ